MTVKELKKILEKIPDDAMVLVEADHGQDQEYAYDVVTSKSIADYGNEYIWEYDNYASIYDYDALQEYETLTKITAICICGE